MDLNWLLVGASTIASEFMIGAIRGPAGQAVAGVVSGSAAHGRAFADTHAIAVVDTDLAAALARPGLDIAYISSTNEKHEEQAQACIAAGLHVLCEKPLAMSPAAAARMVRAAEAKGVVFATNHHLRCSGSHRAIRELIGAGRIGRVLSVRIFHAVHLPAHLQGWRINDAASGGGVIPDITVHDADVVRFLLDEDPRTVVAEKTASGLGSGVEDSAMSVWTMPGGAMVMSHESFTHPFAGTGLEVHGTEGSIFARDVMTQRPVGSVELVTAAGRETVAFSTHDLYCAGVQAFVAAIEGRGRPAASGWDGVKSLAVAHAVRAAATEGRRIAVDYGDGEAR